MTTLTKTLYDDYECETRTTEEYRQQYKLKYEFLKRHTMKRAIKKIIEISGKDREVIQFYTEIGYSPEFIEKYYGFGLSVSSFEFNYEIIKVTYNIRTVNDRVTPLDPTQEPKYSSDLFMRLHNNEFKYVKSIYYTDLLD